MSKLTRVTMGLSHKSMANIDELTELLEEENKTKVVSSSLQITKTLLVELKKGMKLILRDTDGAELDITIDKQ